MDKKSRGALPMLKLTLPIAMEQFFRILVSSVDTMMLSSYSNDAVAAVGLVSQYSFFLVTLFSVIGTGCSIVLAAVDEKASLPVDDGKVVGAEPAVFGEDALGPLRILVIAQHHIRSLDHDFALPRFRIHVGELHFHVIYRIAYGAHATPAVQRCT